MAKLNAGLALTAALLLAAADGARGEDLSELFDPTYQPKFDFSAFWWLPSFEGTIGFPKTFAGADNSLDFRDDLDYGPVVNAPFGQLRVSVSRHWRFLFQYWQVSQSEDVTLDRPLVFDDAAFAPGALLDTNLTVSSATASAEYLILGVEKAQMYFRAGMNLTWISQEISSDAAAGKFSTVQTSPVLGLLFDYHFTSRITTSVGGLAFFSRGLNLSESLLTGNGELQMRVLGTARVVVGYMVYYFSSNNDTTEQKFTLAGPYLGFSVAF